MTKKDFEQGVMQMLKSLVSGVGDISNKVDTLEKGHKSLVKGQKKILGRLETIETDVKDLKADMKFVKQDVSELKRDTAESLSKLGKVEKQQTDHDERIEELELKQL